MAALESFGERLFGDLVVSYGDGQHRGPSYVEVTMIGRRGEVVR